MPTKTTMVAVTAAAASGWQPGDVIALVAILVSAFVSLGSVLLTLRHQEKARQEEREETHRRETDARRSEAAFTMGPALALISEYQQTELRATKLSANTVAKGTP